MGPSIAVIIPILNEEPTISRTLSALRPFQFQEVILVDGGSQDKTISVAQSFLSDISIEPARLFVKEKGRARQMNAGAAQARSEILLFLHADTRLPVTARTDIENAMSDRDRVGGRFDVQFDRDRGWAWLISRLMNLRSRASGISTGDQALFIRRTIFLEMEGYADIPLMEDIELSRRLKRHGPTVALRSKVTTSFRRWEQQGPFRTILRMWGLRLLYWMGISPERLHHYYAAIR